MRNRTSVEVSRASQVHQTPHVGRAQSIPRSRVSPANVAATSAAAAASRSSSSRRFHRYRIPNRSTASGASMVIHAAGTCTYMIFWRSPMSRSGGEMAIAMPCEAMRKRKANHPNSDQRDARATRTEPNSATCVIAMSYLDHRFEGEESREQEDDVEAGEQPRPGPGVAHHVAAEERPGGFHGGEQHRHEHGEEQERQQHLARPAA